MLEEGSTTEEENTRLQKLVKINKAIERENRNICRINLPKMRRKEYDSFREAKEIGRSSI